MPSETFDLWLVWEVIPNKGRRLRGLFWFESEAVDWINKDRNGTAFSLEQWEIGTPR
jgi:hypothetical protein